MPSALPPNSIFLCYRRADSEVMVDRLYEELTEAFGDNAVFRDIDTIPAGVDFPTYIQQSLRSCAVALIFIGRDWSTCTDDRGVPRILDPDDHVRIEIETALSLPHARVIPLLVLHGAMPSAEAIPDTLRPLRRRNGITVRSTGADYRNDVEHLKRELRRSIADVEAARRIEAEKERTEREVARRAADEKEKAPTDRENVETGKKQSAENASPISKPKPVPSHDTDISTILFGMAKVFGAFLLLWLAVKGLEYLPKAWKPTPKPLAIWTPRLSSPAPNLFSLASPTPGMPPGWLLRTPQPGTSNLEQLLQNRFPSSTATPTPTPASPTPRILSPYDKWPLGTPRIRSLEETLRDIRGPDSAASTPLEPPAKATPQQIEDGKRVYVTICVACHQPSGVGLAAVFPPLAESPYVSGSAERFAAMIIHGSSPPFTVNGKTYDNPCPPQGAKLDDAKIASAMTFVRASFENDGGVVTYEVVAATRQKFADRKTPWTQPELDAWK